ncbi:MAG: S-formylglutathione hydrolase [Rhodospirillales bacterium]
MELIKQWRCFGGEQQVWQHRSAVLDCPMTFAVYLPPQAAGRAKLPVLYFLAGLTCSWENFTVKAGAQRWAAEHGLILVMPDTSPREVNLPGEDEAYDFGSGAGFYLDALQPPWSKHYRMYSYVTEELPALIAKQFPSDPARSSIFGHSMGGHGALVCALRNPQRYKSVSAFAPIVAPSQVPWGVKAFTGYLGPDRSQWNAYDAVALTATTTWRKPILIDQGGADEFLATQLQPQLLLDACAKAGIAVDYRQHQGYDHSYYFIATFVADHIRFHAQALAN